MNEGGSGQAEDGDHGAGRAERVVRVEHALTALNRIINGRDADRIRMERSGVHISLPRMRLMRALHERGPMRVVDLGVINHMDKGYASRIWRSLASDGLVHVVPGIDARSTTVALTEHGLELYLRWRQVNTEIVDEVLDRWHDADLVRLTELLERLVQSFREVPGHDANPGHRVLLRPEDG